MFHAEEVELLRQVFSAHSRADDESFLRAARLIVRNLVASNRHAEAKALQEALTSSIPPSNVETLTRLRTSSDRTFVVNERFISREKVVLSKDTEHAVERVLLEHHQRKKLATAGLTPSRKLLFWGPPGCGKTLTSMLVASELGYPLLTMRLSAIITSYVGETSSNLQKVFDKVRDVPSVLLIDEIDALAKHRDDKNDVGELKRVVNTLLQLLDEFRTGQTILIGCTNHQYLLDSAVWRRFDEVIYFPRPGLSELIAFASRFLSGITLSGDLQLMRKAWNGLSFADVEKVLNASVKSMVLDNRENLTLVDLQKETARLRKSFRLAGALKR
jgi:SpoVK/Ycf46/Vps4 family AAA+-type ATPase